eukprot:TRINITY_DN70852_c0_g1_i1.p2 TRINITY_DN70852_c0_g1~~TRINITY_DN70852_c0_g1_i1.p2  ORF type:complete len:266 (+),score=80.81 TRINITY_DN70852_c0_g1_i1:84-800(+)
MALTPLPSPEAMSPRFPVGSMERRAYDAERHRSTDELIREAEDLLATSIGAQALAQERELFANEERARRELASTWKESWPPRHLRQQYAEAALRSAPAEMWLTAPADGPCAALGGHYLRADGLKRGYPWWQRAGGGAVLSVSRGGTHWLVSESTAQGDQGVGVLATAEPHLGRLPIAAGSWVVLAADEQPGSPRAQAARFAPAPGVGVSEAAPAEPPQELPRELPPPNPEAGCACTIS